MRRDRKSRCFFHIGLVGLVLCGSVVACAQALPAPSPSPSPKQPSLEHEFFKNIFRDQKAIWTAPLHLEQSDAKWMVPVGIGTMALFTTDRITGDEIAEFDRQRTAGKVLSAPGTIYGVSAVAASFYLIGRSTNNSRARETGILTAEASVNGFIIGAAIKTATQRVRPDEGIDRSEFFDGGDSFPSGHAIQAWSLATVIANEYHDRRAVQIAAYGVASAVSMARFTAGRHYISDSLIGSLIGYGIGRYVYHAHHREVSGVSDDGDLSRSNLWPSVAPEYSRTARVYGLGLKWSF